MRTAENWREYELIDTSSGERLERWGRYILIRPDPQIIWQSEKKDPLWKNAHARYERSSKGGGSWTVYKQLPQEWQVAYDFKNDLRPFNKLSFKVKPMGFKHTGIFPEQAVNWDWMRDKILASAEERPVRVLNLFAYTGGATLACLSAGANVCHVDASKGMVQWAKENARLCGLPQERQRWIVDDCMKFIARERRRESYYDAIIMDPPSYGRGPSGEVWQLEDQIYGLVESAAGILSEKPLFFIINSYTTGLSPSVMKYIMELALGGRGGKASADEIGLPVSSTGLTLPCGATAIYEF